jgi:D-alanyl-D-alanine carboxypeptidase
MFSTSWFESILRRLPTAAIACIVSLAIPAGAPADVAPNGLRAALQTELDAYVKERGAKEHLSSLSLTVSFGDGRAPLSVVSGTTTFGGRVPVTPSSLYQIGSNTKAFTAVAVLELEAQHRLSIDAPIGDYLPQYPSYKRLTLRQLLSMTGGLESYDNTPAWYKAYTATPMANTSPDTLVRMVYPHIKFPPGTKYYYSNTGYMLAQEVVAARSPEKNFAKVMARIIASAGLKDTFYTSHLYPAPIARRVVAGYYENDDPGFGKFIGANMSGYSLSWAQGAGSIVSTPADLAQWARALYGGAVLPAKQQRELLSLVSVKTAKPLAAATAADPAGFGLGVAQRFDPASGRFWFYQGETLGFRAAHLYFPASKLLVCIFANSRPVEAESKLQSLFAKVSASIAAARS